ncbi:MAG: retention module-containing protein, partial [Rhodocyclaceae bacterium]
MADIQEQEMDMVTPPLQAHATVVSLVGKAFVRNASGELRALKVGDSLREGEVIVTTAGSRVEFASDAGARIDIGPDQVATLSLGEAAAPPQTGARSPDPAGAGDKVVQALQRGGDIDDSLEPPGAGLAGGGGNEGHGFVRLERIVETLNALAFQFGTRRGAVETPEPGLGGETPLADRTGTEDAPPTIISVEPGAPGVTDDAVPEGTPLIYTVTLSNPSSTPVSFPFSLGGGSASPGDYVSPPTFSNGVTYDPATGTISIPAGVTSFTVTVPTVQDTIDEANETVPLSIGGVTGTGTIIDDDAPPTIISVEPGAPGVTDDAVP